MTQNTYYVSQSTSACPKLGASKTPAFRPADPGDTYVAQISNLRAFGFGRSRLFQPASVLVAAPVSPIPWFHLPIQAARRTVPKNPHFTPIVPHFFALYR